MLLDAVTKQIRMLHPSRYFGFFLPALFRCSKRSRASRLPSWRREAIRATCCLRGRDASCSLLIGEKQSISP